MSYNKKVWKSGDRITKEALNNMENGIEAAHQNSGGSGTSYDDTAIKTDINTIKTDLGTDELTTTAKNVKGAVNEVVAQYKDIANNKADKNDLQVQKSRVDNLATLKEGSTTGDAELIDARVGANGATYDNAGDSIRTQVGLLSNDILYNKENKTTLNLYTTFVRGGLNRGNLVTAGNKFRIVSQNTITLTKDVILEVANGFRMGVHTIDSTGTFVADSGWLTTNIGLKKGTSFKIVIARSDALEKREEIANIVEFTKAVALKNIDVVENTMNQRTDIVGSYLTNNNNITNNRLHAQDIICDDTLKIYLLSNLNYSINYGIDLYTNDGSRTAISQSGWLKPQNNACYIINQPCIIHITFKKQDNSSFKDVTDINGLVCIHKTKNIWDLDNKINKLNQSQIFNIKGAYSKPVDISGTLTQNARLHASMIKCNKGELLKTELLDTTTYMYAVDLYDMDKKTVISTSNWKNDDIIFPITKDCYADIILRKKDNSAFSNINEMDGKIKVKKLNEVDTFIFNSGNGNTNNKHKKAWLTSAHRGFVDAILHENTLGAFYNAYLNGADMIEMDARLTKDGVLISNHDATAIGKDPATGKTVTYTVAETNADILCSLVLSQDDKWGIQKIPTLEQVLNLAYNTGMIVNIDIKNGLAGAELVAQTVLKCGMRGKVIYALNGSGIQAINKIIALDPDAKFIDKPENFTKEKLSTLEDYEKRCYAYTSDFSQTNIDSIRQTGCMLATISLNKTNFSQAIIHHPEMCEFPHTSNFKDIENNYFNTLKLY